MKKYLEKIHDMYWNHDLNCATTIIKVLAKKFSFKINKQVIDGLIAIPGGAKHGELCGLVIGPIMFIGMYGRNKGLNEKEIKKICYDFTEGFKDKFYNLQCRKLRPEGFKPSNPSHLCEELTKKVVVYTIYFIENKL